MSLGKEIVFTIHNEIHKANVQEIGPETSLNTYLRDHAGLKGTKSMCLEGGCGACVVTATVRHPITKRERHIAVNSCLVPILACHDWNISTVEGIGNRRSGYHPVQKALAKFNGTQCGFCSGGMVMNMYALLEENEYLSVKEVENSFGGSICRCTGYRPIMDAFKSLCVDADQSLKDKYPDIEDIVCEKTGKICKGTCKKSEWDVILDSEDRNVHVQAKGASWYKVYSIDNILQLFHEIGDLDYRLAAGNTAKGVFRIVKPPQVWIDITAVPELVSHKISENVIFGGNVSLTETMNIMLAISSDNPKFWYLKKLHDHLDVVANVPVRNIGTLAGNLSIKHEHNEFPSDVFLLLEAVGATLTVVQSNGSVVIKTLPDYLKFDMKKCILKTISLPQLPKETHIFESYKITPRVQNAHAYVNAAFLVEFSSNDVVKRARFVYGGINPSFIHATATETYLAGKHLFDVNTIQGALQQLNTEIKPDNVITDASPTFRKNLALALFYKFVLKNAPKDKVNSKYASGGLRINRPLSSGYQDFSTDPNLYPITKPINKVEALIQCSGEIQYINDIPKLHNELQGAFVLAETLPLSTVKSVDTSAALKQPGVVSFVSYKDIPGINSYTPAALTPTVEEVFCSGKVQFNGQPLGLVLAETYQQAVDAAQLVKVTYETTQNKPLFNLKEVLNSDQKDRIKQYVDDKNKSQGNDVKHVVKGTCETGGQYHFTMETQTAIVAPTDDGGYDVYSATQWVDHVQRAIALVLKLPQNKINVSVKRLGGAYGYKMVRASLIATAAAVASNKVGRPIRIRVPLSTTMKMIGKRVPCYLKYDVGVDDKGTIQKMNIDFYHDHGTMGINEPAFFNTLGCLHNCYNYDTWYIKGSVVQTDMPGNCYCRAPGSVEGIGMIEHIMEHISNVVKQDPLQVRISNISPTFSFMLDFINEIKQWSDYDNRKAAVKEYNKNNRWMKKGISLIPMNHPIEIFGPFSVFVAVYAGDGTVAISHGGIESGQGINTKVIQVCAHMFNIPIEMISIKATTAFTTPNNVQTGGSLTSEAVCYATVEACKILLERIKPIKDKMPTAKWPEIVAAAHADNIELCATSAYTPSSPNVGPYGVNGACVAEVEVDLLTGEHNIIRVELIEDAGSSMSPAIDVGQCEGAFMMGVGFYGCEKLIYDQNGGLVTFNTWTYKVPGVKEIPNNFRIRLKKNTGNPNGIFNSKAVGEPPLALSCAIPLAIRQALASARADSDTNADTWVPLDGPTTLEYTFLNSLNNYHKYTL